ncbi:hypothetical protein [uncultured Brevibacillus sp.]|uniref:hypothetical protein n=1 Tax=uncultured Brevibacillus sp. TaxID=169970 RepID=UPI00259A70D6|nr:hypothetical protein [uncultured Brevibacillus sp.]
MSQEDLYEYEVIISWIRECLEETGRLVTPDALDASPEDIVLAYDEKQTGIEWLPVCDLLAQPLYPTELRQFIRDLIDNKQTPIYVGEIT